MNELMLPSALFFIVGAILLPLLPARLRSAAFLLFPLAALAHIWAMPEGLRLTTEFLNYELVLSSVDRLSRIFGVIFALIAFAGGLYAYHIKDTVQQVAALLYAGGAVGVTFAGDLLTLFIFWEIMALASTTLVWARRTRESKGAGMRYLLVHLLGGSALLAGILMRIAETGSTAIGPISPATASLSAWLMLFGVALSAAIPPIHAWLADAYPKATVTGAVFLSAFTTKTAVYVLARMFPGWEILMVMGVMMALYGVVFAVLANDIREILAYHIISQVGYMVAGVGIGTEMSLNGATAHAFSHILYKALLFMGAGVVLHTTGKSKLTELGGLAKAMPVVLWLYMIGAFSISGFPLFNGFISKSMVVSAAGEAHLEIAALLLHLASIGTFLHTGLKLPYFTWFSEDRGLKPSKPPVNMLMGMGAVAFLCALFGVAPSLLYEHLPFPVLYEPFAIPHLVAAAQLLSSTFVAFWIFRIHLAGEPTLTLDTDWFYRRPARFLRQYVVETCAAAFDWTDQIPQQVARGLARIAHNPLSLVKLLALRSDGSKSSSDYDPDRDRPSMGSVMGWVLLCFVIVATLSLFLRSVK